MLRDRSGSGSRLGKGVGDDDTVLRCADPKKQGPLGGWCLVILGKRSLLCRMRWWGDCLPWKQAWVAGDCRLEEKTMQLVASEAEVAE